MELGLTGGQMNLVKAELFGIDTKVQKLLLHAKNVAASKAPILVVGEDGTSKRSLAKYIHSHSARTEENIEFVDCSLDQKRVEDSILGYRDIETGRFIKGAFESSNGGTVVFVNVDSLEETFQRKLHKIITELEDYDLDIRIIATTTKNLSKLVGAGHFYRGLYTLLSSTSLVTVPLRERIEDVEFLARQYLAEMTNRSFEECSLKRDALAKFLEYEWGGNISELKNSLENAVDDEFNGELSGDKISLGEKKAIANAFSSDEEAFSLMSLKEAEKLLIRKALIHTLENRTQAAKILGVSIRTLRNKINEYRNEGNAYFVNLR